MKIGSIVESHSDVDGGKCYSCKKSTWLVREVNRQGRPVYLFCYTCQGSQMGIGESWYWKSFFSKEIL